MRLLVGLLLVLLSSSVLGLTIDFKNVNGASSQAKVDLMVWKVMQVYGLSSVGYTFENLSLNESDVRWALSLNAFSNLPSSFRQGKNQVTVVILPTFRSGVSGLNYKNNFILLKFNATGFALAHEIGHHFGLSHIYPESNLMNPSNLSSSINAEQRMMVKRNGIDK